MAEASTLVNIRMAVRASNGRGRFVWWCPLCGIEECTTPLTCRMVLRAAHDHEASEEHRMNEVHESRSSRRG